MARSRSRSASGLWLAEASLEIEERAWAVGGGAPRQGNPQALSQRMKHSILLLALASPAASQISVWQEFQLSNASGMDLQVPGPVSDVTYNGTYQASWSAWAMLPPSLFPGASYTLTANQSWVGTNYNNQVSQLVAGPVPYTYPHPTLVVNPGQGSTTVQGTFSGSVTNHHTAAIGDLPAGVWHHVGWGGFWYDIHSFFAYNPFTVQNPPPGTSSMDVIGDFSATGTFTGSVRLDFDPYPYSDQWNVCAGAAELQAYGSPYVLNSLGEALFYLGSTEVTPNDFCMVIEGSDPTPTGQLCIGGAQRLLYSVHAADATGLYSQRIDMSPYSSGQTVYFQLWYRTPSGSALSDAIGVTLP